MPVRSLRSSVLRWPDQRKVNEAVSSWARRQAAERPGVVAAGYYGSYARNDWGVGSDVDLIVVVDAAPQPFEGRSAKWDVTGLPVPADLVVYTTGEFRNAAGRGDRFARILRSEVVWVFGVPPDD